MREGSWLVLGRICENYLSGILVFDFGSDWTIGVLFVQVNSIDKQLQILTSGFVSEVNCLNQKWNFERKFLWSVSYWTAVWGFELNIYEIQTVLNSVLCVVSTEFVDFKCTTVLCYLLWTAESICRFFLP